MAAACGAPRLRVVARAAVARGREAAAAVPRLGAPWLMVRLTAQMAGQCGGNLARRVADLEGWPQPGSALQLV